MERDQIQKDGPGSLAYGDTLEVKGIRETSDGRPEVSLSVFGSYVEVEFVHHKSSHDLDGGLKPNIPGMRSQRDLSEEQERYVKTIATLVAGMLHGWYDDRIQDGELAL